MDSLQIKSYDNEMKTLIDAFINGEKLSIRLANTILSTFDRSITVDYVNAVKAVKNMLSASDKYIVEEVVKINLFNPLDGHEHAIAIRLINLVHGGKKFIVINNEIVYIPKKYSQSSEEHIKRYINSVHQSYLKLQRKEAIKSRIRNFWGKGSKVKSVVNAV